MNKQTDAIFAKMVEKYAKTPPENGEITPEIMEEIKSEMLKAKFIADLKSTIEECERRFNYGQIGRESKKSVNIKVSSINFDRNVLSPTWVNSAFEEFMKGEPKIYRLQVNLELPNFKLNSRALVNSPYFYDVYFEFTKYQSSKLTTFVQLKDKNIFPEEIEIEYEIIGKEANEIMINLHKEEIEKLENEIKKLNENAIPETN
jgi:predicted transcriptional regulator